MTYATVAQALVYCGRLSKSITAVSTPSLADLQQFVTDRSNIIDSALKSTGMAVPVTAPAEFLAELVALNAMGAAGDAMCAAYITGDGNDRGTGQIYLKQFNDRMKQFYQALGLPVGTATAETDLAIRTDANDAAITTTVRLTDGTTVVRTLLPGGDPMFRRTMRW